MTVESEYGGVIRRLVALIHTYSHLICTLFAPYSQPIRSRFAAYFAAYALCILFATYLHPICSLFAEPICSLFAA